MSDLQDLLGIIGSVGNSAGVTGDNPSGLNAFQRASLPTDQQEALNKQTSIAALAGNNDFQKLSPSDQKLVMAKVVGDPNLLAEGSQQKFMQNLDLTNRPQAVSKLSQFMSPQDLMKTLLDPMAQGMIGQPAAPASPVPNGSTAAPPAINGTSPAPASGGINMNYLRTQVPPFYQNQVLDYLSGGELPKDVSPKDKTLISNWAHNTDPTFTESIGAQRSAMVKNATSGDIYNMSKTVDTGIGHLYDLHQLAGNLGNGANSIPAANGVENFLQTHLEPGGNPDLERFRASKGTAAPELAKYLGGGAATEQGTADAAAPYDESLPVPVIKQNATDLGAKMITKAGALQDEYNQAMGSFGRHKILSDQSKALYSDMQGLPLTLPQQQLVNQHRAEANLPLKKWGADQTVSKPIDVRPADQPKNTPTAPAATTAASPDISSFAAIPGIAQKLQVEMAKRAALRNKGK